MIDDFLSPQNVNVARFARKLNETFSVIFKHSDLSVYYFLGGSTIIKKRESSCYTMKSTREGMKKILHLKGLKRKIPNKWRVNWPAHISFIRHAFKIQQREFTSGDSKKKAL